MAASRGFEPVYLGSNMPFEDIAEATTQSGSELILLSIARDCSPRELESLHAGLGALSRDHQVWLGIPNGHDLLQSTVPVTPFHQYEDLDRALLGYRSS